MADKNLKVDIITPQSVVFSGDAVSVNVPGSMSPFQVLYNHAAIVSSLENGIVKIKLPDNKDVFYATNSGFVEVKQNVVSILVEQAIDSKKVNTGAVIAAIDKLKNEISSTKSESEKLILSGRLGYEQVKLKASGLVSKN
jgi:F-type H+-transporting ATPase subunit epsilon